MGFMADLDIDLGTTLSRKVRRAQLAHYNFQLGKALLGAGWELDVPGGKLRPWQPEKGAYGHRLAFWLFSLPCCLAAGTCARLEGQRAGFPVSAMGGSLQ